jgi:hypothetical protein
MFSQWHTPRVIIFYRPPECCARATSTSTGRELAAYQRTDHMPWHHSLSHRRPRKICLLDLPVGASPVNTFVRAVPTNHKIDHNQPSSVKRKLDRAKRWTLGVKLSRFADARTLVASHQKIHLSTSSYRLLPQKQSIRFAVIATTRIDLHRQIGTADLSMHYRVPSRPCDNGLHAYVLQRAGKGIHLVSFEFNDGGPQAISLRKQ